MTDRLGYLHGNGINFSVGGLSLPQVLDVTALDSSDHETVTIATLESVQSFTFSGKPTESTFDISLVWQPGLAGHDEIFRARDDKGSRVFKITFPEVSIVADVMTTTGGAAVPVKAAVAASGEISFSPDGQTAFVPGTDSRIQEGMALVLGSAYYPIDSITDGTDGSMTTSNKTATEESVFQIVQRRIVMAITATVTKASQVIQSGTYTQLDITLAQVGRVVTTIG